MLRNAPIREVAGDLPRRWMGDDYFDLYVWYEEDLTVHGFRLCYDKGEDERAITWRRNGTLSYSCVDSGEDKPTANRTPVLRNGGTPDWEKVRAEFVKRSEMIDPAIREMVLTQLDAGAGRSGGH